MSRPVLVVYSRVGGGHLSAARALAAELERLGHSARLVDAYVECGRYPVTRFPRIYASLASRHPRLWSLIYSFTAHAGDPTAVLGPFLRTGLTRLMQQEHPDLVVSVLPVINGLLAQVAPRLEVVLTDWAGVHRFWAAPGVDHYTAPTESARTELVTAGAAPSSIDVVGIPVRRQFSVPAASKPHQERLRILAMVGAEGSPRALRNIAALARSGIDADLVVVCGRNQRLRRAVARMRASMPLRVVGFVEDVATLMRSADVLVTKAGGLTLAEAFCCQVPVVVHDVLPGQEAGNLHYVLSQAGVVHARSPLELVATVRNLAENPQRREELAHRGGRLGRPDAAAHIAARVLARG